MTSILANLVLFVHFLYVMGVAVPIFLIPTGWKRGWWWVHSVPVRAVHASMLALVLFEMAAGVECPLTVLENSLLAGSGRKGYQDSFMAKWIEKIMYLTFSFWDLVALYLFVMSVIFFLLWKYPPSRRCRSLPLRQ